MRKARVPRGVIKGGVIINEIYLVLFVKRGGPADSCCLIVSILVSTNSERAMKAVISELVKTGWERRRKGKRGMRTRRRGKEKKKEKKKEKQDKTKKT